MTDKQPENPKAMVGDKYTIYSIEVTKEQYEKFNVKRNTIWGLVG